MSLQNQTTKEEIQRQLDLLMRERWARLPLSVLAIMMTTIYLPVWVAVICAALNIASEWAAMHYMRGLDPHRHPNRYRFVTGCMITMEVAYVLPAILVWQGDENYAKAFGVGMVCTTLMQMIGMRSVYLPFGYYALLGVAVPTLAGNAFYWLQIGDYAGLLASTVAALGGLGYTLVSMQANNSLHRTSALDRAAALDSARTKSRFLAQMSHELRTPLNAILGMGHAELRRNRDALSQNRLSVLIASAEGLSTILDDILDMSAVEAGHLPIRPQIVAPATEIAATLMLFQPAVTAAGLVLTHDIGPGLDRLGSLDPQRLRQCLSNLLSNAVKNTVLGGVHVTATARGHEKGTTVLIEVADTGPGIPSHLHAHLFEPFQQGQTSLHPGIESNGLGLSISRTMARQMGGDLAVLPNTPTQSGARFLLTLQVGAAPSLSLALSEAGGPAPQLQTVTITEGLRVLVIDDIATNRLVASTYLRMLGATMIEASSGAQALQILAGERPDLVLLDMHMPEMNGLETLAKIRALPGDTGKLPVIAMTADAMAEHRNLYLTGGVDGYLAKPINPARIEAEIRAVLQKPPLGTPEKAFPK